MGKSFTRDEKKHSKYTARENNRRLKEKQQFPGYSLEEEKPRRPKKKWVPHSEREVD